MPFISIILKLIFRHKARQERIKKATEIKEEGNAALKQGELSRAEILYSQALDIERSVPAFWTNRAIGRINLKSKISLKYRLIIDEKFSENQIKKIQRSHRRLRLGLASIK